MSRYKLSICIPTYNFGGFIGETLDSIVSQMTDDVEIIIVDGASTDSTSDIVQYYVDAFPQIKYFLLEARGGIDRDMAVSVDLAKGDYCWIFSADDLMSPGAVNRILSEIDSGYDIYLCRHKNCTIDMRDLGCHPVLNLASDEKFLLKNQKDREDYFALAMTTEAFFSFMGGIIVKRSRWVSIPLNEQFVGSCWAHVARIFELMMEGISIKYITNPYLSKRGENDSFRENGVVQRYKLAIIGYQNLAEYFFGVRSKEAYHVRRVLRNEFTIKHFLYAKLLCNETPEKEDQKMLDFIVNKACMDVSVKNATVRLVYWLTPLWVCNIARCLYEIWLKRKSKFQTSN